MFRSVKRRNPQTGQSFAWIAKSTAMVNHYYFYCVDEDFGPFFLKFCSYFPYNAKLCLNGHEYPKEGRALRTETIINNTRDFGIGKRLCNLPFLRQIGFSANRRLLHVQQISRDSTIGEDAFARLGSPPVVNGQRTSALRFGDSAVQMLLCALVVFRLLPGGFSNRDLRNHWGPLLGKDPNTMTGAR